MNKPYGVKLISIGVDSYFKAWVQHKGSIIWSNLFDTKSQALEEAKYMLDSK